MTATPDALAASADEMIAEAFRPDEIPDTGDPDAPWEITGRKTADWVASQIVAAHETFEGDTKHLREARDELMKRAGELDDLIAVYASRRDHDVDFFKAKLTGWLRRRRMAEIADGKPPKRAIMSAPLVGVTVWSREGSDQVTVVDVEAAVEWAAANDATDVAWREPAFSQKQLRAWLKQSESVVPDGVKVEPATEDDRTYDIRIT